MLRMHISMICWLLFLNCFGFVMSKVNCTESADGHYQLTCTSYETCAGGRFLNTTLCQNNFVFNKITGQCDDRINVIPPCGILLDCLITPDGYYADKTNNCASYFICHDTNYIGRHDCIAGMVFDEIQSVCNHKENVAPPCGTKTGF